MINSTLLKFIILEGRNLFFGFNTAIEPYSSSMEEIRVELGRDGCIGCVTSVVREKPSILVEQYGHLSYYNLWTQHSHA